MRRIVAVALFPLMGLAALSLSSPSALAIETAVGAAVSPSWQTNNTVRAIAARNGAVYIGGQFTSVRPPGSPAGQGEVGRTYLAAFDSNTGDLLSFNHTLDGAVYSLALSPDGSTLYVGGDFLNVDGTTRTHLAAFDTATGTLTSWKITANARVSTIATYGSSIYFGGSFTKASGQTRTRLAAATSAGVGTLLGWSPTADNTVDAMVLPADGSRVVVGGFFDNLNGQAFHAIGSLDPSTGATEPWAATVVPSCSEVKALVSDGTNVFGAGEGTGLGCFDGTFAARASDGALLWLDNCLGATQALAVIGTNLYMGSHAHDCSTVPGGYQNYGIGSRLARHLLVENTTTGFLGSWFPNTNATQLGPRVLGTDGSELFLGGDFTYVNSSAQQGFARFQPGPDTTKPTKPAVPTLTSTSSGVVSVTWPAVTDTDDTDLTYSIYRDYGKTPIATVMAYSTPWTTPMVSYRDAGLVPGSTHTYYVNATDGTTISWNSPVSTITVTGSDPATSYSAAVLADSPTFYWRLGESSGSTAQDATGHANTGIYEPGTTLGQPGSNPGDSDTAVSTDGTNGLITSSKSFTDPQTYSIEAWFKTTTNRGGKIVGFGNSQTGSSSNYDRHVFMVASGQIIYGVWTGSATIITSTRSYNDGRWHHMVATLGSSGMTLYVDGLLVGSNSNKTAQHYNGYWRVGGDNLNGWADSEDGNAAPPSFYFNGAVDEVAVYGSALSVAQVATHYAANSLSH